MNDLTQTLPALTYGTMQWGDGASFSDADAMFNVCLDRGLTHFDTAHLYTGGASETILGQLSQDKRDQLTIATKIGYGNGAAPETLLSEFNISLQRLQTDYVDILYLHRWNNDPLEPQLETLATLQQQGKIKHIGASNFAAWQVMKAQAVCAKLGTQIDVLQPMYSLIKRQAEVELIPMAQDQSIAIIPYSPLGSGLLTGKYTAGGTGRLTADPRYAKRYGLDWMQHTAAALSDVAVTCAQHPATLAVAWAKGHGCRPIISAKNMDQLTPSIAAFDLVLTADQRTAITKLSPTPAPATDRIEEQ
ncbi:MAG: aldo/keto reductase [Planktomarina sp.]